MFVRLRLHLVIALAALVSAGGCAAPGAGQLSDSWIARATAPRPQPPQPPPGAQPVATGPRSAMGVAGDRYRRESKKDDSEALFEGLPSAADLAEDARTFIGQGPNAEIAERLYREADELFQQKKYSAAASRFKKAATRWPDSALEEDALFMQGESHFFDDDYPAASDSYANLLEKYDNSRHLERVVARQFAIGRYWLDLARSEDQLNYVPNVTDGTRPFWDRKGNALAVLESVWLNDPTGPLADDSILATANQHFISGRYADADRYYKHLREDYPKGVHLPVAYLLGIQAKLGMYQGPAYDDAPLAGAQELIEQALLQFPDQLADERERLLETRARLLALQAERNWFMGEYFARRDQFRAARSYYEQVVETAPESELAQQSRSRLQEYADEPDVPENRFQWLVNLFPESSSTPLPAGGDTATARVQGSTRR